MLRKIAIGILALGFIVGAGVFTAHLMINVPSDSHQSPIQDQHLDSASATPAPIPAADLASRETAPSTALDPGSTEVVNETAEGKHEAEIARRIDQLQDLGMENDPASLDKILSELNNPEARVREAAVTAAVQFGSRDAIPRLEETLARTEDSSEKSALKEAVDFLKLPTLTEALSQTNQSAGPKP